MSRRRVRAAVVLAGVVGSLAVTPAAVADDPPPIVVSTSRGYISTTIHQSGAPGAAAGGQRAANGAALVSAGGAAPVCTYSDTAVSSAGGTSVSPVGAGRANETAGTGLVGDSTQGRFVTRSCDGQSSVVWVPNGAAAGPAGVPTVSPEMLAEDARNMLPIPVPTFDTNPKVAPTRSGIEGLASLVNAPTWWWVTNASAQTPLRQRTALGEVWAEVTATPVTSTWDPNDGLDQPVTCQGLGFEWELGMSETEPGHCGVTYTWASTRARAGEDQAFDSELTVTWRITWVGSGGSGGTLDSLRQSVVIPMKAYERQVVNVWPGS